MNIIAIIPTFSLSLSDQELGNYDFPQHPEDQEDESEVTDEFAEDLSPNDVEENKGQKDPWGRRRRRGRRWVRRAWRIYRKYKIAKGIYALGKKDEPRESGNGKIGILLFYPFFSSLYWLNFDYSL